MSTTFAASKSCTGVDVDTYRITIVLEIIGVLPEYQGKRAAGQLIRWGLDQADAEGLEAYVEAWEGVRKLYEKFGFEVAGQYTIERLKHTEYFMVRKPRERASGKVS